MKKMEKQAIISGTLDITMNNLFFITEHSIKFKEAYGKVRAKFILVLVTGNFPAAKLYNS